MMARALLPPVDEKSSKRFSFRYTSIGMISNAVKTQGVSWEPPRSKKNDRLKERANMQKFKLYILFTLKNYCENSGILYLVIFYHHYLQTQWSGQSYIQHILLLFLCFIKLLRFNFIDHFRLHLFHPYSWLVSYTSLFIAFVLT